MHSSFNNFFSSGQLSQSQQQFFNRNQNTSDSANPARAERTSNSRGDFFNSASRFSAFDLNRNTNSNSVSTGTQLDGQLMILNKLVAVLTQLLQQLSASQVSGATENNENSSATDGIETPDVTTSSEDIVDAEGAAIDASASTLFPDFSSGMTTDGSSGTAPFDPNLPTGEAPGTPDSGESTDGSTGTAPFDPNLPTGEAPGTPDSGESTDGSTGTAPFDPNLPTGEAPGGTRQGSDRVDFFSDIASYRHQDGPTGVTVDLSTDFGRDTFGRIDNLENISNVSGTDQNDILLGDEADNTLQGSGGADHIFGRAGDDLLTLSDIGNSFVDPSTMVSSNDEPRPSSTSTLDGGTGNDTLVDFNGNAVLYGGDGNDSFVISELSGFTTIKDFDPQSEVITIPEGISFSDLTLTFIPSTAPAIFPPVAPNPAGTQVMIGDKTLFIENVTPDQLSESNFFESITVGA